MSLEEEFEATRLTQEFLLRFGIRPEEEPGLVKVCKENPPREGEELEHYLLRAYALWKSL